MAEKTVMKEIVQDTDGSPRRLGVTGADCEATWTYPATDRRRCRRSGLPELRSPPPPPRLQPGTESQIKTKALNL